MLTTEPPVEDLIIDSIYIDSNRFSHFPLLSGDFSGPVLSSRWWLFVVIPKVPLGWKNALAPIIPPQSIIGVFCS